MYLSVGAACVQERGRPDLAAFLSLFEHKAREHSKLNRQEVHAITAFLVSRVPQFAMFEAAQSQLRQLLGQSVLLDEDDASSDSAGTNDWSVDSGDLINHIREVPAATLRSHACHVTLPSRTNPSFSPRRRAVPACCAGVLCWLPPL